MSDTTSRLVIEVDSRGVLTATGNLEIFSKMGQKAGKSTDDLANKMGALQLIANKLPGPLKSIASGLMGIVSPAMAAVSALLEVASSQIQLSKQSEEAYIKQEVSVARLGAVLNATGAKTWTTIKSLTDMADSIRRETGRSTEEIMQMQSVLLGFTSITGENFERLVHNMVNMADVMGGSLTGSVNIFGKALENPSKSLNSLTKQGFTFNEEQKRMVQVLEETGRLQEAQVIYLEAMEKAFGDSAKATREAAKETNDYKQAVEDLALARGEFEASGGMTWARFWREFMLPGIKDNARRYREETARNNAEKEFKELDRRADAVSSNYLQTIKTAEELIAVFENGEVDINDLLRAVTRKARDDSQSWSERGPWQEVLSSLEKYKNTYDKIQEGIKKDKERLEGNQKDFDKNKTNIEIAYDGTLEAKTEQLINKIAEWKELRDRTWEISTGVFEGLSSEYKSKIDKIIKELEESLKKASEMTKKPYEGWVGVLARATGFSEQNIGGEWDRKLQKYTGGWGGLETVQKYVEDVTGIQNILQSLDRNKNPLYEALGLNELDVLESSADKVRSVLEAMLNSGKWNGTEESVQFLIDKLGALDKTVSDSRFKNFIDDIDNSTNALAIENPMGQVINQIKEKLKGADIIDPSSLQIFEVIKKNGENYIAKIAMELKDAGRSSYELAVKRLMLEQNISREDAKRALEMQKQIDYITNGYDIMGEITTSINDALRSIRSGKGGYGLYAGAKFAEAGMGAIQGSDAGNFAQGTAQGGWIVGLINMLVGALAKAVGGMEGFNEALNPITGMFEEMKRTLKSILAPAIALSKALHYVGKALDFVLTILSLGLNVGLEKCYDLLVDTNDKRKEEADRLKALNDQYKNLYAALKEQEEYYLQQRRHLNAEWAIENYPAKQVNDMIISPNGAFSTNPKDYIIATKHPETLMNGGAAPVYVTVINNANASVSKQENTNADGTKEIKIIVDGLVQHGIVSGKYDGAFDAMSQRRSGRLAHA